MFYSKLLNETDGQSKVLRDSHAGLEGAEVVKLCAEHQVCQLRVCQEDDEEHDGKPQQVFSAPGHSAG